MAVLLMGECSGVVRDAFLRRGHYALSVDLLANESPLGDRLPSGAPIHLQGEFFELWEAKLHKINWDLLLAFPDCTYLTKSGLHWNKRVPGRAELTEQALDTVRRLTGLGVKRYCVENPPGRIGTAIERATQYIQPYDFGEDASKNTGLWTQNLPLLEKTKRIPGRIVTLPNGKTVERWSNQTDSGQNRLGPSPTRAKDRARFYPGIAEAMAEQWGPLLRGNAP